ncbi:DUF6257 family protein [Streptomyces sp. NPDC059892]|uniref:DUF6257 family protein n=1 Tax=Streptomyces sp. NPDC059892 TaxID=3346989 RepID=UPI00364D8A9C
MAQQKHEPKLTTGEKGKVAWYVARMAKRGIAGEDVYIEDLKTKVNRVIDGARKREERAVKTSK